MSSNFSIAVLLHAYYKLTKGDARLGAPITALFDVLPHTVHPAEILEVIIEAYEAGHAFLPQVTGAIPPEAKEHLRSFPARHFVQQPWTPVVKGVARFVLILDPSEPIWASFRRWFSDEKPTRASTAKVGSRPQEPKQEVPPAPRPRPATAEMDLDVLAAKYYQRATGLGLPPWLHGVKTYAEARRKFHVLANKLHPDRETQPRLKLVLTRAFQNFMDDWEKAKSHPLFPSEKRAAS